MTTDRLLTPRQAAERLERSYDHVLRLIKAGRLPARDDSVGTVPRYRILESDLEELLSGESVNPCKDSRG